MAVPVYIDYSVYPDVRPEDLPKDFTLDVDRAEYVERICGAWDFDIFPERATFELFRNWRDVFERFPLRHSPAYHTFRECFGWPPVERISSRSVHLSFATLDRAEGRDPDPFLDLV